MKPANGQKYYVLHERTAWWRVEALVQTTPSFVTKAAVIQADLHSLTCQVITINYTGTSGTWWIQSCTRDFWQSLAFHLLRNSVPSSSCSSFVITDSGTIKTVWFIWVSHAHSSSVPLLYACNNKARQLPKSEILLTLKCQARLQYLCNHHWWSTSCLYWPLREPLLISAAVIWASPWSWSPLQLPCIVTSEAYTKVHQHEERATSADTELLLCPTELGLLMVRHKSRVYGQGRGPF